MTKVRLCRICSEPIKHRHPARVTCGAIPCIRKNRLVSKRAYREGKPKPECVTRTPDEVKVEALREAFLRHDYEWANFHQRCILAAQDARVDPGYAIRTMRRLGYHP